MEIKAQQEKLKNQLLDRKAKDLELQTLSEKVGEIPKDLIPETIEMVLQTRHAKETGVLIASQYTERAQCIKLVLEALFETKRVERQQLLDDMKKGGASTKDIDTALSEFEGKYAAVQESKVGSIFLK